MMYELGLRLAIIIIVAAIVGLLVESKIYPKIHALAQVISPSPMTIVSPLGTNFGLSQTQVAAVKISPHRISFPSLGLDLAVAEGQISQNVWTLFDDKVSWLKTSSEPGKGNTIVYGHNRSSLFGGLKNLKRGETITVYHHNETYIYEIFDIKKVAPSDVTAILADTNQLTLYTCDGAFDQKRLIINAALVD
jgi:LPXTG-site transpeptidase (sortase) family protein